MSTTYTATYYNASGYFYQATVFLSSVTISIRYRNEDNQEVDVYWLAKDLTAFTEHDMSSELQYRNQQGAVERLVIRDAALVQALKKQLGHLRLFGKVHTRALGSIWARLALIAGIIIGILLIIYLWVVPWLGERMAMGISKQEEIRMGEQMYGAILAQYTTDEHKTAVINDFYKQLHYNTGYPVQITVVASNEINAFAIPGGHIVVYDAILDNMKTPEELAALLGHEASHIALRHSLRTMFRSLARSMFLWLIMGNQSSVVSAVINNADELKGLQYSRSLETAADNNGMQLMAKSGIDATGMLRLMQLLQKESGGTEPSPFLSTHPVFKDRIRNIEDQLKQLPAVTSHNAGLKRLFHEIYE
jgi:Zn-dependent protease with chaperone function